MHNKSSSLKRVSTITATAAPAEITKKEEEKFKSDLNEANQRLLRALTYTYTNTNTHFN